MILFFSQTTKLVFQKCVTGFRVKLTKFPYAEAEIFGFDFGYTAGDGFKKCIMNKYILRLGKKQQKQYIQLTAYNYSIKFEYVSESVKLPWQQKNLFS